MQRVLVVVLALGAAAAACGGKGSPTEPSPSTVSSSASSPSSGPAAPVASPPAGNDSAAEAEFAGLIEALPPATPALTFTAAGRTVVTTAATAFKDGSIARTFADLKVGMHVEVKGTAAGNSVTATRVEIEDDRDDQPGNPPPPPQTPPPTAPQPPQNPEASVTGTLRTIGGTAPALSLTVNTTIVHTTNATTVRQHGNTLTLSALQIGQMLEVEGTRRTDGSIDAAKISIEDDDENENEDENEIELEGTMSGLTGTCPALSFSVGSRKVATNASTSFDKTACSAFRSGDRVQVKGTARADGSVLATRLRQKN